MRKHTGVVSFTTQFLGIEVECEAEVTFYPAEPANPYGYERPDPAELVSIDSITVTHVGGGLVLADVEGPDLIVARDAYWSRIEQAICDGNVREVSRAA